MSINPGHAAIAAHSVVPLRRVSLSFEQQPWAFASERRAEIDAHFDELRRQRSGVWNGQILLLHRWEIIDGVLEGAFLSTDFASFIAWRDFGYTDVGVTNCFSLGALQASDGAWILGVMASHTSAAGKIYFPSGTPDPEDVNLGMVDLAGSVTREVAEETGLQPADYAAEDGWLAVIGERRIALMKLLRAHEPADVLRQRILDHLSREAEPELADVRVVRGRGDLDPMMPSFMPAFFNHVWS